MTRLCHSGGAAREELARRAVRKTLPLYYIGPDRDLPMIAGLDIARAPIEEAQVALAIGLRDDMNETPQIMPVNCRRCGERVSPCSAPIPTWWCIAASDCSIAPARLRKAYEDLGGDVIYYGKPHRPVYDSALAAAGHPKRPLAVGDGLLTDIKGANGAGLEALFIADGVHGEEIQPYTAEHLADPCSSGFGAKASAVTRALRW